MHQVLLVNLYILLHLIPVMTMRQMLVFIPILQMKKLMSRELK